MKKAICFLQILLSTVSSLNAGIKVILNTTPYKIDYTLEANDGTKIKDTVLPGSPSVIEYSTYAASYILADYSDKKDLPTIIYKDPALNGNFMFTFFEDENHRLSVKESNPEVAHVSHQELALEYLKLENTLRKTQNLPAKSTEGIEGIRTLKQEKKGWFSTPEYKRKPEVRTFTIKEPEQPTEIEKKPQDDKKDSTKDISIQKTPAEKIKALDTPTKETQIKTPEAKKPMAKKTPSKKQQKVKKR